MANEKILIVEDDTDILEMVKYNLEKEGFRTVTTLNGVDSLRMLKTESPDLVILDLMLPGLDGLEVCKAIRRDEATAFLPIIMLTAKSQEIDKIIGFEIGADDYITKPFSPRELVARIKAVLRRFKEPVTDKTVEIGNIIIDSLKHKVTISGKTVHMTYTEFKLLAYMAQRPGVVLTRDKILSDVFGYKSEIYDRTVDNHIKTLRKKLGDARDYIETVRGLGYSFKEL
jgi:phosphate regulon transcriptional regulator PhoB